MFETTDNKGFHLVFDNGITLSTQFGVASYCENYPRLIDDLISEIKNKPDTKSVDCEIAIWDNRSKGDFITKEMIKELFNKVKVDDVMGYVTMSQWLKIVKWCSEYTRR